MKNPNCDNDKCHSSTGEVRLLPTGGDSNAILCRACFEYEIRFRRYRNRTLGEREQFKLPTWESLKVYGEEIKAPELTIEQLERQAFECLFSGSDYSVTTIRCVMNDIIDAAEKNGLTFDYDSFNQDESVKNVKENLGSVRE